MIAAWSTLLACAGIQAARAGLTVEYLVVAGGGGGGSGSGGAGGVVQDSDICHFVRGKLQAAASAPIASSNRWVLFCETFDSIVGAQAPGRTRVG
eukprot:s3303_g6.t1